MIKTAHIVPFAGEVVRLGKAVIREAPRSLVRGSALRETRLRELARIIQSRHGTIPLGHNDVTRTYAVFAAHHIQEPNRIARWLDLNARALPQSVRDEITKSAVKAPQRWTADQAAQWLQVGYGERQALGLTTIGAIDAGKWKRKLLKRDREKDRDREAAARKRAAKGAKPRKDYLSKATTTKRVAHAAGVSRSTIHKRQAVIREIEFFRRFVGSQYYRILGSDGRVENIKTQPPAPRLISFRISLRSPPVTFDANELEPLSVRIARATVAAMEARKRLTDLLAEEQERLERELYAPPKKRGRKRKG